MKRIIILMILFIAISPIKAYAIDYKGEIDSIADNYSIKPDTVVNVTLSDIFSYIQYEVAGVITEPIHIFTRLTVIIILASFVNSFSDSTSLGTHKAVEAVCTLMIFTVLLSPIKVLIEDIGNTLFEVNNFMAAFLPVFAGITASSGDVTSAVAFTSIFYSGILFISKIVTSYILPTIQAYFALIISNSLSDYINLNNLCSFFIIIIKIFMQAAVSVICATLTLQTLIAQGTDTLILKAGKVMAGSAIPVIGSVLQDAVGSVYASLEAVKGYAGAVGVAILLGIFAPSVIMLSIYWLITNVLLIFSGLFDNKHITTCIQGFNDIIELSISVVVLFAVMFLFSITIMIVMTRGT